MRKLAFLIFAALAACVTISAVSRAEPRTFSIISVDVPPGWSAVEVDSSVIMVSDDGEASITVTVETAEGLNAQQIAVQMAKALDAPAPVWDELSGGWTFEFLAGGDAGRAIVLVESDQGIILTLMGDREDIPEIVRSMKLP